MVKESWGLGRNPAVISLARVSSTLVLPATRLGLLRRNCSWICSQVRAEAGVGVCAALLLAPMTMSIAISIAMPALEAMGTASDWQNDFSRIQRLATRC